MSVCVHMHTCNSTLKISANCHAIIVFLERNLAEQNHWTVVFIFCVLESNVLFW
jgi:hypothetical protein